MTVENGVKPLEERVAEDAGKVIPTGHTPISDHEVDIVGCAVDRRDERTRKDLRVWDEFEFLASDREEERLEARVRWNAESICV